MLLVACRRVPAPEKSNRRSFDFGRFAAFAQDDSKLCKNNRRSFDCVGRFAINVAQDDRLLNDHAKAGKSACDRPLRAAQTGIILDD